MPDYRFLSLHSRLLSIQNDLMDMFDYMTERFTPESDHEKEIALRFFHRRRIAERNRKASLKKKNSIL